MSYEQYLTERRNYLDKREDEIRKEISEYLIASYKKLCKAMASDVRVSKLGIFKDETFRSLRINPRPRPYRILKRARALVACRDALRTMDSNDYFPTNIRALEVFYDAAEDTMVLNDVKKVVKGFIKRLKAQVAKDKD